MAVQTNLLRRLYTAIASVFPSAAAEEGSIVVRPDTQEVILRAPGTSGTTVDYLLTGSSSSSSQRVVWRPGVPTVPGVSYDTWLEAYTAAAASRSTIFFENDTAPCIVPATPTFVPWEFFGVMGLAANRSIANDDTYQLSFADGAQIANCAFVQGGCRLNANSNSLAVFVFTSAPWFTLVASFNLSENARLYQNQGAAPWIAVNQPTLPVIVRCIRGGGVCNNTMKVDANCTGGFAGVLGASYDPDFVRGPVGANFQFFGDSSVTILTSADIPNFLGTAAVNQLDQAANMQYSALNPAYWAGSPPATVATAIERLAAAVSNNGAIPIP